ncbi:MAG: flavodoxin family protein [Dehalococcoidia bacterium]|nr:flavodoxin family protein [Dehalococcoidia bacterium]
MKALGISGSPRSGGNCEFLTQHTLKALAEEGIETEFISLAGLSIGHCTGCYACKNEHRCIIEDDLAPIYEKMLAADGIILATPVYFSSASSLMKAFMDRTGMIARYGGNPFKGKAGGPLVVGRRGGQNFTLAQMNYWFHLLQFYMTGASYWNIAFALGKGEVAQDKEGMDTAWSFGKNLAGLIKAVHE